MSGVSRESTPPTIEYDEKNAKRTALETSRQICDSNILAMERRPGLMM